MHAIIAWYASSIWYSMASASLPILPMRSISLSRDVAPQPLSLANSPTKAIWETSWAPRFCTVGTSFCCSSYSFGQCINCTSCPAAKRMKPSLFVSATTTPPSLRLCSSWLDSPWPVCAEASPQPSSRCRHRTQHALLDYSHVG